LLRVEVTAFHRN